jgi:hypothetical protein
VTLGTRFYIGAVIATGASIFIATLPRTVPDAALVSTFLVAMVIASLFKLRLPLGRGQATMSMAYVIDFAGIVSAGADVAMVIAVLGVLVQCLARVRRPQPWFRTAFSLSAVALSVQTAGSTWSALGGTIVDPGLMTVAVPLCVAAMVYFAVNTGLVAAATALSNGRSPGRLWQLGFLRTAPGYLLAALTVATTHILLAPEMLLVLPAVAVPVAVCHLAYARWFQRLALQQPSPALT